MRRLFVLLLFVCMAQPALCDVVIKTNLPVFSTEIQIDQESLQSDSFRKNGRFYVRTRVKNTGGADGQITIWTQQGWSWISDNDKVAPGTEAAQNVKSHITLKPGQEYDGVVEMLAAPDRKLPLTFRLGFLPNATKPISDQLGMAGSKNLIWSNGVMLVDPSVQPTPEE